MMPDSTQSEKTEKRATKRKASKKKEKSAKKKRKLTHRKDKKNSSPNEAEAKSKVNSDTEYDSDLDLNKELKPIGAYIKNREEMLKQMFKTIKGDKLKSMLPEILKNCPLEEIKALCLDQLEVMSKKRICAVLAGQAIISSSGTEDSSSDEETGGKESVKEETEMTSSGGKSSDEKASTEGNVKEIYKNEDDENDDTGDKSSPDALVNNKKDGADSVHCDSNSVHGDSDVVDSTTDQQDVAGEVETSEAVLTLSPLQDDENDSLFNDIVEEDGEKVDAGHQGNSNHGAGDSCLEGNNGDPECSVHDSDHREDDMEQKSVNRESTLDNSNQGGQEMVEKNRDDVARHEETSTKPPEQRVQTRLELLELEMRARAIRSLMKANEKKEVTLKAKLQK